MRAQRASPVGGNHSSDTTGTKSIARERKHSLSRANSSLESPLLLGTLFLVAVVIGDARITVLLALVPSLSLIADFCATSFARRFLSGLRAWALRQLRWTRCQAHKTLFASLRFRAKDRAEASAASIMAQCGPALVVWPWVSVLMCLSTTSLIVISFHRAASQLRPGSDMLASRVVVEALKIILQPLDSLLEFS